ncbi:MAG: acyl-CoA thioesterase [Thermoanaerobaculia bacterium]
MNLATFDDFLNPKFVFFSPVQDALNTRRLEEHVDRAIIALDGQAPIGGDWSIEQLNPVLAGTAVRVELWVNNIDDFTCTYGFLASSSDGRVPYARGERIVVCIDPASRNPSKWSSDFRHTHAELLKNLPAYA